MTLQETIADIERKLETDITPMTRQREEGILRYLEQLETAREILGLGSGKICPQDGVIVVEQCGICESCFKPEDLLAEVE